MARKTARPGRTLAVFFVVTAIIYGLVAIGGLWKPALGLDLQGGTRVTLIAKGSPTKENLLEARSIIDDRVNGSGVTEGEVTTQGSNIITVEIPGPSPRDLVDTVARQAQLRFRLVACSSANPTLCSSGAAPGAAPSTQPGAGVTLPSDPSASPSSSLPAQPQSSGSAGSGAGSGSANRPPVGFDELGSPRMAAPSTSPSASPSPATSPTPSDSGTASTDASPLPTATTTASPSGAPTTTADGALVDDPLKWINSPDPASVAAFNAFSCPADGTVPAVDDDSSKPLVTCGSGDTAGQKFLLSKTVIEGTELTSASAGIPQNQVAWAVSLRVGGQGRKIFSDVSRTFVNTGQQFAIVLDGAVISSPGFTGVITNGEAQITGGFNQQTATSLATSLKYGSLPIAFEDDPTSETVGPSLAGDQLSAGITAGIVGLILVMIYCLVYYRGLGLVVISSLLVAGGVTYALVLLLSAAAGFTLSLPGIAGLIVAVGITADSFVVFFERIRDEMRDGKSMRVAVEAGWARARNTCVAADTVSLLAAVVLYIFGAGVVKGFAFALGLSTVIDLAVFFWFTKPMVSYLAQYRFFNRGHKLSGLDAEALGVDRITLGRTA